MDLDDKNKEISNDNNYLDKKNIEEPLETHKIEDSLEENKILAKHCGIEGREKCIKGTWHKCLGNGEWKDTGRPCR